MRFMRIERIDDKTMKCFLSKEELEEYDISYKDFITRSEKAIEVMEEIMAQAEVEVGFRPPQFAFELQIMVLPDQSLVLIVSEKSPGELPHVKDMAESLNRIKQALGIGAQGTELPPVEKKAEPLKEGKEPAVTFAVFAFPAIRDICKYAQMLPGNLRVKSALYEMDGVFYLFLEKGSASYERYSRACIRALEFGSLYTATESNLEYIREHGECLIPDHAVKKLRF